MKQLLQLTLTLTLIAAISGFAISKVNQITSGPIAEQKIKQESDALKGLLSSKAGSYTQSEKMQVSYNGDTIDYWRAIYDSGDVITLFKYKTQKAYSSKIEYLAAVEASGKLLGLSILSQAETPGLGARMVERISPETFWSTLFSLGKPKSDTLITPWFSDQFIGLSATVPIVVDKSQGEWHKLAAEAKEALRSRNGVTAITGATISTKAITDGLQRDARAILAAIPTVAAQPDSTAGDTL